MGHGGESGPQEPDQAVSFESVDAVPLADRDRTDGLDFARSVVAVEVVSERDWVVRGRDHAEVAQVAEEYAGVAKSEAVAASLRQATPPGLQDAVLMAAFDAAASAAAVAEFVAVQKSQGIAVGELAAEVVGAGRLAAVLARGSTGSS